MQLLYIKLKLIIKLTEIKNESIKKFENHGQSSYLNIMYDITPWSFGDFLMNLVTCCMYYTVSLNHEEEFTKRRS